MLPLPFEREKKVRNRGKPERKKKIHETKMEVVILIMVAWY